MKTISRRFGKTGSREQRKAARITTELTVGLIVWAIYMILGFCVIV